MSTFGIPDFGDGTFSDGTTSAGGSGTGGSGGGGETGSGVPIINSFIADLANAAPGQAVTLTADVTGATSLAVDPYGPVVSWPIVVFPITTTTYTLTAANANGSAVATLVVGVSGPSGENVRYHQVRTGDREGSGKQFQMYGGESAVQGYPAVYDGSRNVFGQQPRGNSGIPQMASAIGSFTPGGLCAFDQYGNIVDGSGTGGVGSSPYHIVFEYVGFPADGQVVGLFTMPADLDATGGVNFPDFLANSRGRCQFLPTASAVYTLTRYRAGASAVFCTISVNTAGAFTFSPTGDTNLIGGDLLVPTAPSPPDPTLGNVSFTLAGRR